MIRAIVPIQARMSEAWPKTDGETAVDTATVSFEGQRMV